MDKLDTIKTLYRPLQPTIGPSDNGVSYRELKPKQALSGIVYCFWQLRTIRPLEQQFIYRVVADGCIDIFFDMAGTGKSFIMGFCKKYTEFPLANFFNYVGIRFYPTMFPQLFHISAKELSNNVFELNRIVPELAKFIENKIIADMELPQIAVPLHTYLTELASNTELQMDHRLYRALHLIFQNQGILKIETDLDIGISPRQLRRLFNHYIGTSPKTFSKVIQFQNVLRTEPTLQSLRENKIFYDSGYSDQAHFIRDFKNFYGVTPTTAFK